MSEQRTCSSMVRAAETHESLRSTRHHRQQVSRNESSRTWRHPDQLDSAHEPH